MTKGETKEVSKSLNLLAKSSLIVLIGLLISKVFSYIYRIIIARNFGAEEYGIFSIALVILGFFITLSMIGTGESSVRYASMYKAKNQINKVRYLFRMNISLILTTSIIFGITMYFSSTYLADLFNNIKLINYFKLFSFLIPISAMSAIYLNFLRSYEKIKEYSFSFNIVQNVIKLVSLIIVIFIGFKINSIILSYSLGILSMLIFSYYYCIKRIPEIFKKFIISFEDKAKVNKEFFRYSWPLLFYGLFYTLFYWIDTLSLGYLKGATEVGWYNAAVPIALLLLIVPELFMQLFFPLITRYYSNKKNIVIGEISKQVNKWIFIVNFPILILIFLFPETALNILFGKDYLIAADSLRILSIGLFVYSLSLVSNNLVLTRGKSNIILLNMVLSSLLNIILNFILIPLDNILNIDNSSGLVGASMATTISVLFLSFLFIIQARRYYKTIPFRRKIFNVIICGFFSYIVLFYLREIITSNILNTIIICISFLITYVVLNILLGSLDKNDLYVFKSLIEKIKVYKHNK